MLLNRTRPILITGSHRSGTTWIGRTISQYPTIRYIQEPFNVNAPQLTSGLKLDTWFTHYPSSTQKEEIDIFFSDLFHLNPLVYAIKKYKYGFINIKSPLYSAKNILKGFLKPRILIKDPVALLSAGWLYETYDFKVIVMIRNPLAFVGSLKMAGWDFNFEDLLKQEVLMQNLLMQFYDDIESKCLEGDDSDLIDRAALLWNILHLVILEYQSHYPEWLFVKYEEIAADPKSGFQKIFDYLGLQLNDQILKYIEKYTSKRNPEETKDTQYKPRNSKLSLHTWKKRLTKDEIERVKTATHDLSSLFYENGV